ncbi:hypothetical protein KUCAC02_037249, partial [Chaenocephalus aceratus]
IIIRDPRTAVWNVSVPKHGKIDATTILTSEENQWAGGTGGRDTAGLGGKGGPYRLDAGHKVHQVSQAEKDAVPEEVRKAAREMGEKAFRERVNDPSQVRCSILGKQPQLLRPAWIDEGIVALSLEKLMYLHASKCTVQQ